MAIPLGTSTLEGALQHSEASTWRLRHDGMVAISSGSRAAWRWLADIAFAIPGTVIVGLDGTTLRIREDGRAEEIDAGSW
jgi:hypothetical protein